MSVQGVSEPPRGRGSRFRESLRVFKPKEPQEVVFFFDLGLFISSSSFAVFWGWAAGPKFAKRFVSAGFASGGVFRLPFGAQKMAFKSLRKVFASKTNGAKSFLFLSHVSTIFGAPFFGQGCGARFWAPYNARKMPCSDPLERSLNRRFCVFQCVLAAVLCVFGLKFPLSLRFREVPVGHFVTRGLVNHITHEPLETLKKKCFWLGRGGCLVIYPNFAEKNWKWIITFGFLLRVEGYDLPHFGGNFVFCFVCIVILCLDVCCFAVVVLLLLLLSLLLLLLWFFCCCSLLLVVVVVGCCCCWLLVGVVVVVLLLLFLLLFVVSPRTPQQINKQTRKTLVSLFFGLAGRALPRERPTTQNNKKTKGFLFPPLFFFVVVFLFLCFICFCFSFVYLPLFLFLLFSFLIFSIHSFVFFFVLLRTSQKQKKRKRQRKKNGPKTTSITRR